MLYHGGDIPTVRGTERASIGDWVPSLETTPTAGGRCVLGDEYGMVAHGGLLAIINGVRAGQSLVDEFVCVLHDGRQALFCEIRALACAQPKAGSEFRSREGREEL